jgi:23S rRNA pseudouridine955/2504/2580 synthase
MLKKDIVIPQDYDGKRASDFLRFSFPDLPESAIRKLFAARDLKLDHVRISRDQALRSGQVLTVFLPGMESGDRPPVDVVYEDEDILLVNKRPGISVEKDSHGGTTLTDLCAAYVLGKSPDAFPPAACHRLDNRTSGLCLFAKNSRALEILQDAFRKRDLEKEYICLVRGIMKPPQAVCHAWLVKDPLRSVVRITDHPEDGAKPITTGYETLESGPVSRLRVQLMTGRTHQIRAHLAALGHPILGDDLYGDRDFNRRLKARSLKLCAVSLKLETGGLLPRLDGRTFTVEPPF